MGRHRKYFTEEERLAAIKRQQKEWREKHKKLGTGRYGHQRRRQIKNKKIQKIKIPTYKTLVSNYTWLTDNQKAMLSTDAIYKILNKEKRNAYSREYQKKNKDRINKWRRDVWYKGETLKAYKQTETFLKNERARMEKRREAKRLDRILHPEKHLPKPGKSEDALYELLVEKYGKTDIIRQKEINDGISSLFLDFYIGSLGMAIEYNGEQHYMPATWWHWTREDFENQTKRDERKRAFCKSHGIKLLEIDGRRYGFDKIKRRKFKGTLESMISETAGNDQPSASRNRL